MVKFVTVEEYMLDANTPYECMVKWKTEMAQTNMVEFVMADEYMLDTKTPYEYMVWYKTDTTKYGSICDGLTQ